MTKSETLARILETYSEEEIYYAKDEPDTTITAPRGRSATIVTFYGSEEHAANATRRRVKRAFHDAGHGQDESEAIANARRVFRHGETW